VNHSFVQRDLIVGFEPIPRSPGGIARYSRELSRALEHAAGADVRIRHAQMREWLRPLAARLWAAGIKAPSATDTRDGATESESSSLHATSVLAPPRGSRPLVVTIHDTVPFTHPHTLTRHGAVWHRAMVKRAVRDADAIVVPTRAVADGLLGIFERADGMPHSSGVSLAQRIHVGGGAASLEPVAEDDARLIRDVFDIGRRPYVVFVGTIEPRKGLADLIRTLAARPDLDLAIVGAPGWGNIDVRQLATAAGLDQDRLIVTGAVHDATVAAFVQGARALVLPSRAEGFGLPLLEAMRLGTPVVLSDDAALREVAGDAGIVAHIIDVEANDPEVVVRELNRALDESLHRRDTLIEAGLRRSAEFTWAETAARVLDIHRQFTLRN
jgi:glycosyltransferase involved in cell wall biosynthesis